MEPLLAGSSIFMGTNSFSDMDCTSPRGSRNASSSGSNSPERSGTVSSENIRSSLARFGGARDSILTKRLLENPATRQAGRKTVRDEAARTVRACPEAPSKKGVCCRCRAINYKIALQ